ncbi:hypothetical protein A2866_04405 [Candidatus Roizmanbacteria bacterium RIFCSPHIGHO2_01_FULL_39_8]|uniref:Secondary thiamine-phosphate synthase enzyme n=2 Tax=Candidatus Roizmaniibacteriota TaxID=1752723 RepID=A0A1F7GRH3_9BACT|nr:MAG: hypothetical protein A2866_04405 [Candidatus Roizmanbacteria bacterium RIFCSPHIGHO2_01_FULL_39_8]OGK25650.1 MAG: hypothetical protein A3C28_00580 [Candidatus Roizmanbacteria bacterium RIFCSPHIGHO2_02_FULL_39_9]
MVEIPVKTGKKKEIVDITNLVKDLVKKEDFRNGSIILFLTHTTAALTIADLDPGTDLDMLDAYEAMIPKLPYRHPHDPSHVPSHILSSLIGVSVTILVRNSEIVLGEWQRIVLAEFDGPKDRKIIISFHE